MINYLPNKQDIDWLEIFQNQLSFELFDNVLYLKGLLIVDMIYNPYTFNYILYPNPIEIEKYYQYYIKDKFNIKIPLSWDNNNLFPKVFEIGNRIKNFAKIKNIRLINLHYFSSTDSVCLCLPIEEKKYLPNGFNLIEFFESLVIPYFYSYSYYEHYLKYPWGDYSHGQIAYFEYYQNNEIKNPLLFYRNFSILTKKYLHLRLQKEKNSSNCICNCFLHWENIPKLFSYSYCSNTTYKRIDNLYYTKCNKLYCNCHNLATRGFYKFKKNYRDLFIKS